MKTILALASSITLISCGSMEIPKNHDAEIMQYITEVMRWSGQDFPADVISTVEFVDSFPGHEDSIGICKFPTGRMWFPDSRAIGIQRAYWNSANEADRYQLVAHELGHCAFNLPHTEGGLMHPNHIYSWDVAQVKEAFLVAIQSSRVR